MSKRRRQTPARHERSREAASSDRLVYVIAAATPIPLPGSRSLGVAFAAVEARGWQAVAVSPLAGRATVEQRERARLAAVAGVMEICDVCVVAGEITEQVAADVNAWLELCRGEPLALTELETIEAAP